MDYKQKNLLSGFGLLVTAAVLFVGVMLLSTIKNVRLDLTEDKLYTLSDGTKNILNDLDGEPILLSFFYSDKLSENIPALRAYARRVEEMLLEYELQSDGQIVLNIVDPEPFSEDEDIAANFGLQGVPTSNDDTIYFGLVGQNATGSKEIIEFFNPQREEFLEYDISQLVYRLDQEKSLVVGVLSSLPIFQHVNYQTRQTEPPKVIIEQLRQLFDIKRVYDPSIEKVDEDIDLLVLVHPHLWPQSTLYAIDQFVLGGGRLLVFMDPNAELDVSEGAMFQGFRDKSSSLEQLLDAWGVDYDPKKILTDYKFAHGIPVTRYGQALPHIGILGITEQGFNREETMVSGMDMVNIATAGVLAPQQDASTTFTPLMRSSDQVQLVDSEIYNQASDHSQLLRNFAADGNGPYTIAAFVRGPASSAFPDGKPVIEELDGEADSVSVQQDQEAVEDEVVAEHLTESQQDIAVVLFADTDLLDDRMWVDVQEFYGQQVAVPWASNSDLVVNVLEQLSGSVDLINVRSRGTYNRPFEKVAELERQASEQFRAEEERLMARLEETESRLMELSGNEEQPFELTPEQEAEVEKFQQERLQIRKKLRDVQHQLNKDIEQLGTRLKIINTAAIPLLLVVFAVVMALVRSKRRKN